MAIDFDYLCRITAHLSGIPVRVYEGERLASFHSPVALAKDPMVLYREPIWRITGTTSALRTRMHTDM